MSDTFLSATGDGLVRNAIVKSGNTWSGCRSAGSGTFATYTDTNMTFCEASNDGWGDSKYYIDRGFLAFDTSALPDNALLTGATLSIWVTGVNSSAGGSFVPVEGTQASTSSLATSDFGAVGSTEFASRQNFSGCPTGQYVDFALNASGLASINLSGYTKFAFRASFDIDNSAPTNGTLSYITVDLADSTGTSHDPKLVVSYVTLTSVAASDTIGVSDSSSPVLVSVALTSPAPLAADAFTDSNGTQLTSHTSTTGGYSWLPGYYFTTGTTIESNALRSPTDLGDSICPLDYTPASADYDVSVDVTWPTTVYSGNYGGLLGRWVASSTTGYFAGIYGDGTVLLYRYGGAGTGSLGSYAGSVPTADVAQTLRLSMRGTSIVVYVDGVARISVTESSITAAGSPGVRLRHVTGARMLLDNFSVNSAGVAISDTVTFTEGTPTVSGPVTDKSASDTVTATDTSGGVVTGASASASDTATIADTSATTRAVAPSGSYAATVSQGSTPPQVVQAASGASDGLNYNAFPGMCLAPPVASLSGSRQTVANPASTGHPFQGFPGFIITQAGTRLVNSQCTAGETSNPDYGTLIARKTSGGGSWSNTLLTPYGMGDCWLFQWPDGEIWAGGVNVNEFVAGATCNIYYKSTNDGVSWTGPFQVDSGEVPASSGGSYPYNGRYCIVSNPPLLHDDGVTVLMPVYRRSTTSSSDLDFYVEVRALNQSDASSTLVGVPFPYAAGYRFEEAGLAYRADGALMCFARTGTPLTNAIWANVSYDDGVTWGTPRCVLGPSTTTNPGYGGRANVILGADGLLYLMARVMILSAGAYYSGTSVFTTSVDGFSWATPRDLLTGGAMDTTNYHMSGGTEMSMYGQFANGPSGVELAYGSEYGSGFGAIYWQAFTSTAPKLILAYHHANDHTATGTGKINAQVGTYDGAGGYTWSAVTTLATTSGVNSCDVGCTVLGNGDVMVTWNESSTPGHANVNTVVNWKYRKTSDQGATYATAVSQAVPGWATTVTAGSGGGAYAVAPCKPIRLRNGDLLMATYGWDDRAIEDGGGSFSSREYVKCVKSTDNGATWSVVGTIFPDTVGTAYDETDLLLLDNGTILAACRHIHTGLNIVTARSTDDGATWSAPVLALGTDTSSSGDGYGGRPDLYQTESGGVLLRVRYMNGVNSSWPEYRLSVDRGVTWGAQVDPYTGSAHTLGTTPSSPRGMDIYGAFSKTATPNVVAYVWSEEVPFSSVAALYFRLLTVTVTENTQSERFTVSDSAGVTVGVGAITKTASDGFNVTDTSGGLAVTYWLSSGETVVVADGASSPNTTTVGLTASDVFYVSDASGTGVPSINRRPYWWLHRKRVSS